MSKLKLLQGENMLTCKLPEAQYAKKLSMSYIHFDQIQKESRKWIIMQMGKEAQMDHKCRLEGWTIRLIFLETLTDLNQI
jgi:hypothetical protein